MKKMFLCFVLSCYCLLASCSLSRTSLPIPQELTSLYIHNSDIVDPRSNEIVKLRGVNLGQWFLWEGYLWGLNPEPGYQRYDNLPQNELLEILDVILPNSMPTAEFWDHYQKHFITEWDFAYLKNLGVNTLRIPIHYFMFEDKLGLTALKRNIDLCEEFEMHCILDIHAVRGAQSSYSPSDPIQGRVEFWKNKQYQEEYFEILGKISDLSKDKFFVIGYDLLNEPEVENVEMLRDFYQEAITFLRKREDWKLVLVQPNKVSLNVEEIYLGELANVIYSPHYYGTSRRVQEDMKPVWEFAQQKNVPILIGEYGNWANDLWAKYSDRYIPYVFEIYEFHHLYWPYKDLIPSSPQNDNNFGLFSGPRTELWQEFFSALSSESHLREDFPFEQFFQEIQSEKLEEKELVVEIIRILEKGIVEVKIPQPGEVPERYQRWLNSDLFKEWSMCDRKSFQECRSILPR